MRSDENFVQALNYSAHYLDQVRPELPRLQRYAPEDGQAMGNLVRLLDNSQKLILPDWGELLDPEFTRQTHLDLLKLPYPVTALEYPVSRLEGEPQSPASRRIALCWEPSPHTDLYPGLSTELLTSHPQGGVCVMALHWSDEQREWNTPPAGIFIPYRSQLKKLGEMAEQNGPTAIYSANNQFKANTGAVDVLTFTALPEKMALAERTLGHHATIANTLTTTQAEVQALIGACAVLNCRNVITDNLPPPAKLNKKRQENGKQPFYTYKILDIEKPKAVAAKGGPTAAAGNGFRPREHLRRAHIRDYGDHTACIASRVINVGIEKGKVLKQYRVHPGNLQQS